MSDGDRDRDGGGLAVLVLAGFLVLFMLLCGGGATWEFVRQREMEARRAATEEQLARANQAAAQEAAKAVGAEADAPAPESDKPTQ